jgi:hypothetical protein
MGSTAANPAPGLAVGYGGAVTIAPPNRRRARQGAPLGSGWKRKCYYKRTGPARSNAISDRHEPYLLLFRAFHAASPISVVKQRVCPNSPPFS